MRPSIHAASHGRTEAAVLLRRKALSREYRRDDDVVLFQEEACSAIVAMADIAVQPRAVAGQLPLKSSRRLSPLMLLFLS